MVVRGLNVLDRFRQKQYTWKWPSGSDPKKTIRDSEIAQDLGQPPDEKADGLGWGSKSESTRTRWTRNRPSLTCS